MKAGAPISVCDTVVVSWVGNQEIVGRSNSYVALICSILLAKVVVINAREVIVKYMEMTYSLHSDLVVVTLSLK